MRYLQKLFEAETGGAGGVTTTTELATQPATPTAVETAASLLAASAQDTQTTTETNTDPNATKTETPATNTITLINDKSSEADVNAFYTKLGRPESFDKYELTQPEGFEVSENLQNWAKENFFKAGLSSKQANELYQAYNELAIKDSQAIQEQATKEINDLKKSYGDKSDYIISKGKEAVSKLGLSQEDLTSIERALGSSAAMVRLFSNLGMKMSGDNGNIVGANTGSGSFGMTKAQASEEIARLTSNADFKKVYYDSQHPQHDTYVTKIRELYQIAHKK